MKDKRLAEKEFCFKITTSMLAILACAVIMVSSAYALFCDNVSAKKSTIVGAYYTIDVSNTSRNVYIAPLAVDDLHFFEISAKGTASTGYCKIKIGGRVYYTESIRRGDSIIIAIQAARDSVIEFVPHWGELPMSELRGAVVNGGMVKDSQTPHAVYNVEPAARLASIAAYYGATEQEIVVYNNLPSAASSALRVGMDLKIPGEGAEQKGLEKPYSVPYAIYIVEPTAKLESIADYYNVPEEDIRAFNSVERFSVGGELKIPNAAERSTPYAVPFAVYTVEPTARLEAISAYYGVSAEDILTYNKLDANDPISSCIELRIPSPNQVLTPYSVPYAVYTVEPTAKIELIASHYGSSVAEIQRFNGLTSLAVGKTLKIPYPQTSDVYGVPYATYVIEPAVKLAAVASFYGVSLQDILLFNQNQTIDVGYVLRIPSPQQTLVSYSVPYTTYTVEPTAKLEDIASHYGVPVADIQRFNGITNIEAGKTLKIPYPLKTEAYAVPYATYTIPADVTLAEIADYYGVTDARISAFNKGVEIKAGATIKIPGVSPDTVPYAPPAKPAEKTEAAESTTAPADQPAPSTEQKEQ